MKNSKIAKSLSIILSIALMFSLTSLSVFAESSHSHAVCGNISHDECNHSNETFTVFDPNLIVDPTSTAIIPGNYYLNSDINLADFPNFLGSISYGTVTICLNGHTITGKAPRNMFSVYQSGTLNICDCSGNGKLVGSGIINLGKFNMYGGEITGNGSTVTYEPVRNYASSTFTMYGGKIIGYTSTALSSAVYNNGTFIMRNGEISNNQNYLYPYGDGTTSGGTAGAVYNCAYFEMTGGKIVNNAGVECGGVNNNADKAVFMFYGGTIEGNYLLAQASHPESNIRDVNNNTQYLNNASEKLDGVYYIRNVYSGKYLDVAGISAENGANIQQWSYTGADNQLFQLVQIGDAWAIKTKVSNCSSALDVAGWGTDNGTNVAQWEYHGGNCQLWYLERV